MSKERIQKLLAQNGYSSRRKVESLIKEGRIYINDNLAQLGDKISADDKIFIDGNSMIEIYNANTISYSSNQMHGDYVARIGIYRDSYENSHEVQFDDWEIKSRK